MSNTNKTTLIIPDLHHRWMQAEKIISSVGADEIIFLGDFFDDFNDDITMVKDTSDWLVESVNKPNRIHLIGNHEMGYAYTYRSFQCSGYAQWKYFIIFDNVPRATWDKLKWYHFLDDTWLLSHGGLHNSHVPDKIKNLRGDRKVYIKALDEYLQKSLIKGFRDLGERKHPWIFNAGYSRGGFQKVGGITWCDYTDEFYPLRGINQIVGHTPQGLGFPRWCILNNKDVSQMPYHLFTPSIEQINNPEASVNIDLDVWGNTHYGVWNGNGKTLTVGDYKSL